MSADNFLCISQIRRQAIKGLPDLCKDTPEHLPRIADVLTQLLQSGIQMYKVAWLKAVNNREVFSSQITQKKNFLNR